VADGARPRRPRARVGRRGAALRAAGVARARRAGRAGRRAGAPRLRRAKGVPRRPHALLGHGRRTGVARRPARSWRRYPLRRGRPRARAAGARPPHRRVTAPRPSGFARRAVRTKSVPSALAPIVTTARREAWRLIAMMCPGTYGFGALSWWIVPGPARADRPAPQASSMVFPSVA